MNQWDELGSLLRELYHISGFRVTLHDTDFREIASYPNESSVFCGWIQQKPEVRKLCEACDLQAFEVVRKTKELHIYHCHCGLFEAVAPLYDFGVLSGYLMMGQMIDTFVDSRRRVAELSKEYVDDMVRLEQVIAEIPTTTKEKIASYVKIMSVCAEYITLTNRMNLGSRNLADEVKRHIGRHYAEKLSIESLARQFLSSKSTLMNGFKERFGITINRYISQVRLEHASELLLHTDLPIHEVADGCGFSDQNYFAKVFFKEHQLTPTQFRQVKNSAK